MSTAQTKAREVLGVHVGGLVMRASENYDTLNLCILEAIQNSLDENSTHIWVDVNLKDRCYTVRDNGNGVTRETLSSKLSMIGFSFKAEAKKRGAKEDFTGRYGIGNLAPLAWCEYFTITSRPATGDPTYYMWKLSKEEVKDSRDEVPLKAEPRRDLFFDRHGKEKKQGRRTVQWRTEIMVNRFSNARSFLEDFSAEGFETELLDKYSGRLLAKKCTVELNVVHYGGKAEPTKVIRGYTFTGTPLPRYEVTRQSAGRIKFDLRLRPTSYTSKKKTQGGVFLSDWAQTYQIPFSWMSQQNRGYMNKEVREALMSGTFEGYILVENITRNLQSKGFVCDDAFYEVCLEANTWYEKVGKDVYRQQQEAAADQALREAAEEAVRQFRELQKDPAALKFLDTFLNNLPRGVGRAKDLDKYDEQVTVHVEEREPQEEGPAPPPPPPEPDKNQKEPRHPLNLDPEGKPRPLKPNSSGIYPDFANSLPEGKLWELSLLTGVVTINRGHYLIAHCGDHGGQKALMKLILWIMISAPRIYQSQKDDERKLVRGAFDDLAAVVVYQLTGVMPVEEIEELISSAPGAIPA